MRFFRKIRRVYADLPPLAGNTITDPQDLTQASWTKGNGSVSTNAIMAPNGAMTADLFIANTNNTIHGVSDVSLTTTGGDWIARMRVKSGGYFIPELIISNNNSFTKFYAGLFDTNRKVFVRDRGATYTGRSRCLPLTDGWLLCESVVYGVDTNSTHRIDINIYKDTENTTFAGDNAGGVFIWNAEFAPVPN